MKQYFEDFEEFVAATPEVDARWLIAGKGKPRWYNASTQVGNCILQHGYSETPLSVEGAGSTEGYGIYVPDGNSWKNNGEQFDTNSIMIFEPGAEFCVPCSQADGWNLIFFPKALVPDLNRDPAKFSYVIKNQKLRCELFREKVKNIIDLENLRTSSDLSFSKQMMATELELLMQPVLNYFINSAEVISEYQKSTDEIELMLKARGVMEQRLNEDPVHIGQLASLLNMSERSLRYKFDKFYNLSPYKYLLLLQLYEIHHDLVHSNCNETSVTDIFTKWGVWEFGRFAGRYKKYFGELPSETLKRCDI